MAEADPEVGDKLHLITQAKSSAVAYHPPPQTYRGMRTPMSEGEAAKLIQLFDHTLTNSNRFLLITTVKRRSFAFIKLICFGDKCICHSLCQDNLRFFWLCLACLYFFVAEISFLILSLHSLATCYTHHFNLYSLCILLRFFVTSKRFKFF